MLPGATKCAICMEMTHGPRDCPELYKDLNQGGFYKPAGGMPQGGDDDESARRIGETDESARRIGETDEPVRRLGKKMMTPYPFKLSVVHLITENKWNGLV